jgi:hypothetical protein
VLRCLVDRFQFFLQGDNISQIQLLKIIEHLASEDHLRLSATGKESGYENDIK